MERKDMAWIVISEDKAFETSADEIRIEPSGVLSFWNNRENGVPYVVCAYGPRQWSGVQVKSAWDGTQNGRELIGKLNHSTGKWEQL